MHDQSEMIKDGALNNQTSEIKPGLDRMHNLLNCLHPQINGIRFIHIAGTNGKGSLGSYCMSVLAAAGYKTGWFSSPHLQRKSECIRMLEGSDGLSSYLKDEQYGEISATDFDNLNAQVEYAARELETEGKDIPSDFEFLTMIALLYFSINKCDWVIWEAGMGGGKDATNILQKPVACLITAIGLDHMQWLGSTYEAIAAEKAGIIKNSCPVYLYDPADAIAEPAAAAGVYDVFKQRCLDSSSDLFIASAGDLIVESRTLDGQVFRFNDDPDGQTYMIRQLGVYQPQLASMAVRFFRDFKIDEKYIRDGLSKAIWPGRMEICRKESVGQKLVLLDGAHNPQGCKALEQTLAYLLPGEGIIFVTGMLADKDSESMLSEVFDSTNFITHTIISSRPAGSRAMPARDLADKIAHMTGRRPLRLQFVHNRMYNSADHVFYSDDAAEAVGFALELSAREQLPVCVFGSLYLAGMVRPLLVSAEQT